jgi:hypothetical protein
MYKLLIKNVSSGEEETKEFESSELAVLYRDYHLAFGQWNSVVRWVQESHLAPEQQRFIVDEKTELINGKISRLYKLSEGIELKIEEVDKEGKEYFWKSLRKTRDYFLQTTDWTQLADAEIDTELRKEYRSYRAYLRVLPKLHDDSTIFHAKVYDFEDWKKGKR